MAYLYVHIRKENDEIFYVGIGSDTEGKYIRAHSKKRRSKFWKDMTKNREFIIKILHDNLSWKEVCEKEKELIELYGRKDLGLGPLVNLTNGGEGVNGYSHNEERLNKIRSNSEGSNNGNAKACIHFDTKLEFKTLKEGCEHFKLKYRSQGSAIKRRQSTAQFYFKGNYFLRPTREEISKKLGLLRIGNTNSKRKIL